MTNSIKTTERFYITNKKSQTNYDPIEGVLFPSQWEVELSTKEYLETLISNNPEFFQGCEIVEVTNYTYDVYFNSNTSSDNKGFKMSLEEAQDYIEINNGTNESYFEDYKGGTVSIYCNETEEVIYETAVL